MQLHALADNANWKPEQYFPFDLVTLEGAVRETIIDGLTVNGNRAGTYCFRMKGHSLNAEQPRRLTIRNAGVTNVHGGFVRVDKGDCVSIEGNGLGSVSEKLLDVAADSGLSRYYIHELGTSNPAGKSSIPVGKGSTLWTGQPV
jgi:hypothetical protein